MVVVNLTLRMTPRASRPSGQVSLYLKYEKYIKLNQQG